jgi:tripartite-type tricarboxylate transporter receptor subunit TctC
VAGIDRVPLVMEVTPSFPAKTIPEFIAYAKANPGKINMASAGIGGPQHAAGELFKYMAGVDMVHVPYRGSTPAVTDLIAGQVQVMFDVTPTALPQVKSGTTRALGVSTVDRLPALPDVPPIGDFVKGYEAVAWVGLGAPKGTPPEIVETLNKQVNAALLDATIQKRLADLGATTLPQMPPAEFAKYVADDVAKWAKMIKATGMKPG